MPNVLAKALLAGCSACVLAAPAASQTLSIDLAQTDQQLLGFGAQIWPGDAASQQVVADLGGRFARVHYGTNFFTLPTQPPTDTNLSPGDNFDQLKAYVAANFNGDFPVRLSEIQATSAWAAQNGVELVLNEFQIAHSFLNFNNTQLVNNRVDDFATFWGALLSFLDDNGVRPAYVELANEPEGTHNGFISPFNYNRLVTQTREVLDAQGFQDVGILGPGISFLGDSRWIDELDTEAVASLAGWSSHAYDDDEGIDSVAAVFENAILAQDPGKSRPVFITEFATDSFEFNGQAFGDPDFGGNAADQPVYAVEVINNAISLVNHGATSLLAWQAADQDFDNLAFGLERRDGTRRPVYDALKNLTDRVPDDSTVVEQTWSDDEISVAAFLTGDQLVVAIANTTPGDAARTLNFASIGGQLQFAEGVQFDNGGVTSSLSYTLDGDSLSLVLLGESTQTLVFDIMAAIEGDFNGDGVVNAADYTVWRDGLGDEFTVDDYELWAENFDPGGPPALAVPEPPSLAVLTLWAVWWWAPTRPAKTHRWR